MERLEILKLIIMERLVRTFFLKMKLAVHELCYSAAGANIFRLEHYVNSYVLEDLFYCANVFCIITAN